MHSPRLKHHILNFDTGRKMDFPRKKISNLVGKVDLEYFKMWHLNGHSTYHRYLTSFSTVMGVQIDGTQTTLHDHHPKDDSTRLETKKMISQRAYSSWMVDAS